MKTLTCDHCLKEADARTLDPKTHQPAIKRVRILGIAPNTEMVLDFCAACRPMFKDHVAIFLNKA